MFGYEPVFDLSIPTVREIGEQDWRNFGALLGTVPLIVDGYPIYALLRLE